MNCQEYQKLTPLEKSNYVGSLIHACISDSKFYAIGEKLIQQAIKKGLFQNVVINPPSVAPELPNDKNEMT